VGVLSREQIKEFVGRGEPLVRDGRGLTDNQYQPCGVDLRIWGVSTFYGPGSLTNEGKDLPEHVQMPYGFVATPNTGDTVLGWYLNPGSYLIDFRERVELAPDVVGFMLPRSTLLRQGVALETAVWDPGYKGTGQALLVVFNPQGWVIERGAPIAQLTFHRLDTPTLRGYSGSYQEGPFNNPIENTVTTTPRTLVHRKTEEGENWMEPGLSIKTRRARYFGDDLQDLEKELIIEYGAPRKCSLGCDPGDCQCSVGRE
jgi:dUTP pyrophosphatase